MLKYLPVFALFAVGPAFAQGATQTPPAPQSSASGAQTSNSLPVGAANTNLNSTQNPHVAGQAMGSNTTHPAARAHTAKPVRGHKGTKPLNTVPKP